MPNDTDNSDAQSASGGSATQTFYTNDLSGIKPPTFDWDDP